MKRFAVIENGRISSTVELADDDTTFAKVSGLNLVPLEDALNAGLDTVPSPDDVALAEIQKATTVAGLRTALTKWLSA